MLTAIAIAIAALLLTAVFGVAAWQVASEDRAERAMIGDRIDQLMRQKGLTVGSVTERDGVTTVGLRTESKAPPVADRK